jgi:hypothetical protein
MRQDLLMILFVLTVANLALILGGLSVQSPYSRIGSYREIIEVLAYEPILVLIVAGIYLVTGSFGINRVLREGLPLLPRLPLLFLAFLMILPIKLRKSPFDLSGSHHAHQEICCASISAGKHLMAEKPVGLDLTANRATSECAAHHPQVFVRCASQWIFYPGAQRIGQFIERGAFGRIIEVNAGFLHSSDLDPNKPINWKRQVEFNGEYGVMGDLGMHVCALPFRAQWIPQNVRAVLSKIVKERPDGRAGVTCSPTIWGPSKIVSIAGRGITRVYVRVFSGLGNLWILGGKNQYRGAHAKPRRREARRELTTEYTE